MGILSQKVVSNDSGRSFDKSYCPDSKVKSKVFQAVMAPAETNFNLTVKTEPSDLWIDYQPGNNGYFSGFPNQKESYLLANLAIRQKPKSLITDRDGDKSNRQNIIQTLVACSFYAKNENIVLLTNVPAGEFSRQYDSLAKSFKGVHRVTHKAGDMTGVVSEFNIAKCYVFPECESAYFGAAYDLDLNLVNKDLWQYPTLIIDIGDETTNYVSMGPGGDPIDDASGTLPYGVGNEVYKHVLAWATKKGAVTSIPEIARKIIYDETLFVGNERLLLRQEYNKRLADFEYTIYSQLNSLLSLKRYRNLLPVGGIVPDLKPSLDKRYHFMEICHAAGSQMLNCYGQYIIYRLSQG